MNEDCHCISLDTDALARALDTELGTPGLAAVVRERCPFVFAAQPVFVATRHLQRMAAVVQAIESVVALPAWREAVLPGAPDTARVSLAPGQRLPRGVFFGHDFHLDQGQLRLIEVNTNAGGALLNAVAIVDEAPETQYLHAEFLLFQRLFERHGLHAVIADPDALDWRSGRLWHGDTAIDLVYNRLTDFYLEQPGSAALRQAWMTQTAAITPHPQAHALYADKRHLAVFSDEAALVQLGVPEAVRALLLAHVPRTEVVLRSHAARLWAARRGLFFKPAGGYGSRAAWRGDKLTRRVWEEITAQDGAYVAQTLAPPGQRQLQPASADHSMKFDLRTYAYDRQVQWVAARLYQGQTTNFRTAGGGFAPVYSTCC